MELSAQTPLVRDNDILSASLDDELVLLSMDQNRYFGSGEVGRRIWDLCERPCSVEELVERLVAEYDVAPERCRAEVMAFCSELLKAGLLNQSQPAAGS